MDVWFSKATLWVRKSLPSTLKILTFRLPKRFVVVMNNFSFEGLGWTVNCEL